MADETPRYTAHYYRFVESGSLRSARQLVPLLVALLQPNRVLDVGCGTGAWLLAFQENGVADVFGIDLDSVPVDALLVAADRFARVPTLAPFESGRNFDLVVCLEVAEHLPERDAEAFVDSLTRSGPVVAFSAAIPGQGGTGHVNEQWPDYWAAIFGRRDFVCIDCLRSRIWNNAEIAFWFRQNILLFVDRSHVQRLASALGHGYEDAASPLAVVHPELFRRTLARMASGNTPAQQSPRG